jgi:DNA helicase-2/ATP-dependent DNA helicase PcrA
VVVQPADDLAFDRIVNLPKRGLGNVSLQPMHVLARGLGIPLTEAAARLVETDEMKPKARAALAGLLADLDRWRASLGRIQHPDLAAAIIDQSGYAEMWRSERTPDAQGRLENLRELVAALREYSSLPEFLEHVSLVMENDDKAAGEQVQIMTLHGAKGLEFDAVYLPGWEENIFPHQRALAESGDGGLEEERRLAYVGLTRARRRVFVSYSVARRVYNKWQNNLPSRFISDIPAATVDHLAGQLSFGEAGRADGWERIPTIRRATFSGTEPTSWQGTGESPEDGYKAGDRIFHRRFGYGVVIDADGDTLEVSFDRAGVKKVVDRFVGLA